MPTNDQSVPILCRYRVKPGKEAEFTDLLSRHWQTLHGLGLTTDEPARLLKAGDKAGNSAFIEQFSWKEPGSAQAAHESVSVMKIWEPMGAVCTDMEFWEVAELENCAR